MKVSVDTCRGTIAQQQAEIKKLSEALEIRNNVIIQLQGQVGHAADHLATREAHTTGNATICDGKSITNIDKNVSAILSKLEKLSSAPVNHFNIHNNSVCHRDVPLAQPSSSQCKNSEQSSSNSPTEGDKFTTPHTMSSSYGNPCADGDKHSDSEHNSAETVPSHSPEDALQTVTLAGQLIPNITAEPLPSSSKEQSMSL